MQPTKIRIVLGAIAFSSVIASADEVAPPAAGARVRVDLSVLPLAKKCAFLTGEGPEPVVEVLDVGGLERLCEHLVDDGKEVVEGSDRGQRRT